MVEYESKNQLLGKNNIPFYNYLFLESPLTMNYLNWTGVVPYKYN